MRLTPELFDQITGFKESSLEQLQRTTKGKGRTLPRLPLAFRSFACCVEGERLEPPVQVQICDISVMGVGLTHAAEDRLGKTFVIALQPRREGKPIAIHCEMVNFQSLGQTRIRVGAKFMRLGTEQDARRCLGLSPAVAPAGKATSKAPSGPSASSKAAAAAHAVTPTLTDSIHTTTAASAATARPDADEVKRIRDAMLS